MTSNSVKFLVGLLLAGRGVHSFGALADRLGITGAYLSQILSCVRRPAHYQRRIAAYLERSPQEIFGTYTSKSLLDPSRPAGAGGQGRSRKIKESK